MKDCTGAAKLLPIAGPSFVSNLGFSVSYDTITNMAGVN